MPVAANVHYFQHAGETPKRSPAVVFLHGAGGSYLSWPGEMRRLPGYHIYALDLPGHGKSGGRGGQSIGEYVLATLGWMDAVALSSAVLVGHSLGSAIALSMALDYPERVRGLCLIGAGARLRVAPQLLESAADPAQFQATIEAIILHSFSAWTAESLTGLVAKRMAMIRPEVLHADFVACNAFDVMERIGQIHTPAVVLCGEKDQMTPPKYARFLVENIGGATLQIFPKTGHMLMLEQPQMAAGALADFLAAFGQDSS